MANILLVDDELNILKLGSFVIKSLGHTVFTAISGKEALVVLENNYIDAIVTDLIMPEVDGFELCTRVGDKYPVIIASAMCKELKNDTPFVTKSIDFIAKPFDISVLKSSLNYVLYKFQKITDFQPEPSVKLGNIQLYKGENVLCSNNNLTLEKNQLNTLYINSDEEFTLPNIIKLSEHCQQTLLDKTGGLRVIKNVDLDKHQDLLKLLNKTNLALGKVTGIFLTDKQPSDIIQKLFDRVIQ